VRHDSSTLEVAGSWPPSEPLPPSNVETVPISDGLPGRYAAVVLYLLACVPIVGAIMEVLAAPLLNYFDFWPILGYVTHADGSFAPGGLLTIYNGHPIVLAGLIFFLDAEYLGGTNHVLGFVSVVLAAAVVVALRLMLPARLTEPTKAALTAAFAFLVFSTNCLEYFAAGMSGTHWLSGLAPAIFAILLAGRGRTVPAVLLATLGCLGHGSAFPVWLALVLIAWLRRDRPWRMVLPLVVGVVVLGTWAVLATNSTHQTPTQHFVGIDGYLTMVFGVLGQLGGARVEGLGAVVGVLVVVGLAIRVTGVVRARLVEPTTEQDAEYGRVAAWAGLAVFGVVGTATIALGRADFGADGSLLSRYAAISALSCCALLTLFVVRPSGLPTMRPSRVVAIAVVVGLGTYVAGDDAATGVRSYYATQVQAAIAIRLGALDSDNSFTITPGSLPRMKALHIYPFNDLFTLGCDGVELGQHVDLASIHALPTTLGSSGSVGFLESTPGSLSPSGWALVGGVHPDCVLVTDGTGKVVGGGRTGIARADVAQALGTADQDTGLLAVAAKGTVDPVVLVSGGHVLYRLLPNKGTGG
jgi:hypothetical protein